MKDVAAQAEEPPAKEAEKKEDAGKSGGASAARPANAAAPLTRVAPPAAPAALAFGAAKASEGTMTTLAGAEARIGTKVRTISGLTPLSVEMVPVVADSLLAVRQHYVVSGVPVVLVQQVSTPVSHDTTSFQLRKQSAHDELSDVQSVRSWVAWGSLFQLRGNLPADSLDALMKRVK